MNKSLKYLIIISLGAALIFALLSYLNLKKSIDIKELSEAVGQIGEMESHLIAKKIDWTAVEKLYSGPLKNFVKETKRFASNSYLHGKIVDSITEGQKGDVGDVAAIILRRTWLRVCLFYVDALMAPQEEQEQNLSAAERIERVHVVMPPVRRFVAASGEVAENSVNGALRAWEVDPDNRQSALDFHEAVADVLGATILIRLAQWRREDVNTDKGYRRALVLQAEMRQLIFPVYAEFYDAKGRNAWEVLTEFTRRPTEMDPEVIEERLSEYFEGRLEKKGLIPKNEEATSPAE
ncbi:MAG: hypothetical protein P9L99_19250 [Candidatus Lernaella stagnicola]|nr:hypothetical protein [Candidatus Lernaella stagnicola]